MVQLSTNQQNLKIKMNIDSMLYLIGLGLCDEKDISLRGLEQARKCKKLFIETYTSFWKGQEKLEKLLGKKITELRRSDLEEDQNKILEQASREDVAILIPGDPLVATTHISVLIEAKKTGIKTRVIHASSIYTAVAETGLMIYKFGKTTTIPYPEKGYFPRSPYDTIRQNRKNHLHTLVLLDVKSGQYMTPFQALNILLEIEEKRKENVISPSDKMVVFSVQPGKTIGDYESVKDILKKDYPVPCVLIFPGNLHPIEAEALGFLHLKNRF